MEIFKGKSIRKIKIHETATYLIITLFKISPSPYPSHQGRGKERRMLNRYPA
jgi:hypothetical protein